MFSSTPNRPTKRKHVYCDPIYGIPHFHDPAILRIAAKHDPIVQLSKSIKSIALRSEKRLISVSSNKTRFVHSRFNIDTLFTSPLMCFPHFAEMTQYLDDAFRSPEYKRAISTLSKKSNPNDQKEFDKSLFLLLQEIVRASPLSSQPLIGIYNWFIQNKTLHNTSGDINRDTSDSDFQSSIIPHELFSPIPQIINESLLSNADSENKDKLRTEDQIGIAFDIEESVTPSKRYPSSITPIGSVEPLSPSFHKRNQETFSNSDKFDYPKLHKRLVEQREAERELDDHIAKLFKRKLD